MKILKNCAFRTFLLCVLSIFSININAQQYADSLEQADVDILSSIAPYDIDTRSAILSVAQYPQTLVKIGRLQSHSSQVFQDMVAPYPREDQEKLYEMSRFPDLINSFTSREKTKVEEVKPLLKDFPEEAQIRMLDTYEVHYDELVKMNKLYKSTDAALQKIIAVYPQEVQKDFRTVTGTPDVINLLVENMNLTITLGEEYKNDPVGIRMQLDTLSKQLTDKNELDLSAYKKEVEQDSQLQTEMKKAATDFSSTYTQADNPVYVTNTYYDNYPYPYWFSYPYWYSSAVWYPRPMYYHTGFYYGANGNLVVVALPSHLYSTWFFGGHYRHYPRMYNHYNNYYSFHRNNVYRGFNTTVYNYHKTDVKGSSRSNAYQRPSRSEKENVNTIKARINQLNVNPDHFNNKGMDRFNATTYHSMGWQNSKSRSGTAVKPSGGIKPIGKKRGR